MNHITIPQTLNGYDVIAALPYRETGNMLVVVVYRHDDAFMPFVVARWTPSMGGNEWWQGDYLATRDEALHRLVQRAHLPAPKVPA